MMIDRLWRVSAALALALGVLAPTSAAAENLTVERVMVGGEADLDACGGLGIIEAAGAGATVRAAPASDGFGVDTLVAGQYVWMCDEAPGFIGVVYGEACGVSSPIAVRQPYDGPCRWGWVADANVTLIAG